VENLLYAIKRPYSFGIKQILIDAKSPLLARLTIEERPGKMVFRFWQEGPGYDRNLTNPKVIASSIDYIHLNPQRRNLVKEPIEWRWSSCRYYATEGRYEDPALPKLHGLPSEIWNP
jgi:putative transposase